jgi:hypothetical protein
MDVNTKIRDFVRDNPDVCRDDQELCSRLVEEHNEYYPVIPTPYLIPETAYADLCRKTELIHRALEKVLRRYRDDRRIRDYFGHLDVYAAWLDLPVVSEHQIPVARFDLVEDRSGRFNMIESNTCCPVAPCRLPAMMDMIRPTKTYRFVSEQVNLIPLPLQDHRTIFNYLVMEYEKHFEKQETYRIGIGETTAQESVRDILRYKVDSAVRYGCDSEIMAIQDLQLHDGSILHRGRPVHVLYQFLDVHIERDLAGIASSPADIHDYLEGMRRKALLVVNPFPAMFISEDKSMLALLRNPAYRDYFDAEELAAVEDLVPETFRLRDEIVEFEGEKTSLLPLLRSRKDDLVIKGQMANSGNDVTIGHQTSAAAWEAKIRASLGGLYVVQKYVAGKTQALRDLSSPEQIVTMNGTLAMCLIGGKACGMDNRLSTAFVTNCARGGVTQNVLVYADHGAR